jgi:dienelactone hydrolase
MRRVVVVLCALLVLAGVLTLHPAAQSKPTLKPADYGQFESVSAGAGRGGLSPDGRWLAYAITRVGGDNELRIVPVGAAGGKTVPFGSGASYASNSQWVAYGIGQSDAEAERLRAARQPVQRKLGLLNLATNTETIVEGIESFGFDRTGRSLAMRRYAPAPAPAAPASATPAGGGRGGRGGAPAAPAGAVGTTLMVRNLATGADITFGNVTEYAWQAKDDGRLLAMIIGTDGQAGNGVQLYDPATSVLRVLDAAQTDYSALAWRDDSSDLLVFKAVTDDAHDGPTQQLLVWTDVGAAGERRRTLDPTAGNALPSSQRVVTYRRPSWLTGPAGAEPMILVGVADWPAKPAPAAGGRGGRGGAAPAPPADEKADVDVWHWKDTTVMSAQKLSMAADRRRNLPAVWHVDGNRLVVVGKSFNENVSPIRGTAKALVSEYAPYLMERSIGRGLADLYLADLPTGGRTLLKKGVGGQVSASTGGQYVIYAENGHYFTIDLATGTVTNITAKAGTSFTDVESDSTSPQRPMFGIGGWTKDDEAVVLYDKYDIWKVSPRGTMGSKFTSGADSQMRVRLLTIGREPGDPVDLDGAWVTLFGTTTKQSGYGRLTGGTIKLVYLDKSVSGLAKAEQADVFSYLVQDADDSPDLFVGGPDLARAKQITNTNAFLSNYAWTRAELVNYTITRGRRKIPLQGILQYPANYEPGRKYPMVVYLYERLSDNLHRFTGPSERDYYNGATLTQNGYFFFQPDIVFAPGEPGVSVAECVTAAVNTVVSMGAVDGAKVGVMGHSWGGFDAMFLATHTKIFAAAVSGAGIADLISNYGNGHWSSGIAETDHIETGQQRMVVPLYEDLDRYVRNSAIFGIATMTTPLLLEAGNNDGTVFWHQSVELYNIARRAGKNVVMLVYNGEDHGLRVRQNQIDYQRRIHEWFDHYLKGAAAPKWITEGVPALERDGG